MNVGLHVVCRCFVFWVLCYDSEVVCVGHGVRVGGGGLWDVVHK